MRGGEPGEGYDKGATHQDAWRAPQHRQLPTDAHGLNASLRKGAGETRAEGLPFRQPLGYAPRTPPRRTPGVQPRPPARPRREEGRHSLRRAYAAPPRSVPKLTHDVALAPAPSPHARKRARGGVSRCCTHRGQGEQGLSRLKRAYRRCDCFRRFRTKVGISRSSVSKVRGANSAG